MRTEVCQPQWRKQKIGNDVHLVGILGQGRGARIWRLQPEVGLESCIREFIPVSVSCASFFEVVECRASRTSRSSRVLCNDYSVANSAGSLCGLDKLITPLRPRQVHHTSCGFLSDKYVLLRPCWFLVLTLFFCVFLCSVFLFVC